MSTSYQCTPEECGKVGPVSGMCEKHRKRHWHQTVGKTRPKRYPKVAMHKYQRTPKGKYANAKISAKNQKISWNLPFDVYEQIIQLGECFYCQGPLNPTGSGLDRLDTTMGYNESNVVTCCRDCNRIKCHLLTSKEMVAVAHLLKAIRSRK